MMTTTATKPPPEADGHAAPPGDPMPPLALDRDASIHARMVAILADLPPIGRDAYNEQQRFHFRSYDSMLIALNPLLAKHGVYVVPDVIGRERHDTRVTSNGKTMYEVNLHVRFRFYGLKGDYVECSAWGEGTDMGDKSTNKAATAAFKYALNQAFAISTAEAIDMDASSPEQTTASRATGATGGRGRGGNAQPQPQRATWKGLEAVIQRYGGSTWDTFVAYSLQAAKLLWPDYQGDTVGGLPADRRDELAQRAAVAAQKILDAVHPDDVPGPDRRTFGEAWKAALDGQKLPGPEWRLGPDDPEGLPLHPKDAEAAALLGSGSFDKPDPEADNVPFGDGPA